MHADEPHLSPVPRYARLTLNRCRLNGKSNGGGGGGSDAECESREREHENELVNVDYKLRTKNAETIEWSERKKNVEFPSLYQTIYSRMSETH